MKSAANVIAVVEALATGGPAGLGELSRRTAIAKSTVQRCLATLADAGWITATGIAEHGGITAWELSDRFAELTAPARLSRLAERARPVLAELARTTGDAVHLATLDGTDVVLVDRVAGAGIVQIVLPAGFRVPAYAAATGKAMLAALPAGDRDRHLPPRLSSITPATVATRAALDHELDLIAARGWATNLGEWEPTVAAVAAAVHSGDRPIAAVSVSTTPPRLPPERLEHLAAAVVATARQLSTP